MLATEQKTKEFGKGFSVSNIQFMRRFYQNYEIQQTVSVKLSWSHYCELLSLTEGKNNQETVLALAQKGIEMSQPIDIVKDPYVFEFLGVPENKSIMTEFAFWRPNGTRSYKINLYRDTSSYKRISGNS